MPEEAVHQKQTHTRYLEALLRAELEEREHRGIQRRLREAHLPRVKTLGEFDFSQAPKVSAGQVRELAEGGYMQRAEPVIFLGEAGTGKTHLAIGLYRTARTHILTRLAHPPAPMGARIS